MCFKRKEHLSWGRGEETTCHVLLTANSSLSVALLDISLHTCYFYYNGIGK